MQNTPDGPLYVLDHLGIYQLFRDPAFLPSAPAFLFLEELARAVIGKVNDLLLNARCRSCGSPRETIAPLAESFASFVVKMHQKSPQALEPVIQMITRKLGYRPRPIVLYHRKEGKIVPLEL